MGQIQFPDEEVKQDTNNKIDDNDDTAEPNFDKMDVNSCFSQQDQVILNDKRMEKLYKMSEDERDLLTCDEVFCLYLGDVSKMVNPTYYKNIVRFVMLYRDCLNELGWQKRREHFIKSDIPLSEDLVY